MGSYGPSGIARIGLDAELDAGHTIDIGALVREGAGIHGALLEEFASGVMEDQRYRILLVHGVSRDELEIAIDRGIDAVIAQRRRAGTYPRRGSASLGAISRVWTD